jgi:tetratricopeptide (TPR) repeat protein
MQGIYTMMYYSHNLHFGAIAASMQGRCTEAQNQADRLAENVRPGAKEMPMLEAFMTIPLVVAVRCQRWDSLLPMQQPAAQTPALKVFWLYSRGSALAARGKTAEAEALQKQLASVENATPSDDIFMPPVANHSRQIFHIANDVLSARIAVARHNQSAAIELLRDAVANQDQLLYDEPADWYYPVRESLGGLLLQTGDATAAEAVFRKDLELNPRNPRSLFGLHEALVRQKRTYEAAWVQQQFDTGWQGADVQLRVEDL